MEDRLSYILTFLHSEYICTAQILSVIIPSYKMYSSCKVTCTPPDARDADRQKKQRNSETDLQGYYFTYKYKYIHTYSILFIPLLATTL